MLVAAGEAVDLVLDRGTVARPDPLDHPGKHRRAVESGADDVVGAGVGVGDPARHLARMLRGIAHEGKHRHRVVARLHLHYRVVDAAAVEARRRAGLEAAGRQLQFAQALRQRDRRWVAEAAGAEVLEADMHQAVEEGAGGEHHGRRLETDAELGDDAADLVARQRQVVHRGLEQCQVRLVLQAAADRLLVHDAVGLGAGGTHRRTLGGVEDAELDAGFVGRGRHRPAEGIDLLDQVTLADAADRGVARHGAQRLDVVRQ